MFLVDEKKTTETCCSVLQTKQENQNKTKQESAIKEQERNFDSKQPSEKIAQSKQL